MTGIVYTPSSGVAATPSVGYGYDAAGNRTSMTDGLGSASYNYNQLSQLLSEARTLTNVGTFTLSYDHNLAGELKKITDPTNMTINYSYDSTGRMTNVTGSDSLYAGVSNYASNLQYRAWGSLKHMEYGNALTLDQQFNNRLQVTSFQIPGLMTKSYDYYSDARVNHSFNDAANSQFDRAYSYDQAGRVTQAVSGPAARGEADTIHRPYLQSYTYDGFDHLTSRTGLWWRGIGGLMSGQQYQNERNTAWSYDADGRLTNDANVQYSYDAAGSASHVDSIDDSDLTQSFDGDGERAKSVEVTTVDNGDGTTSSVTTTRYYLRSSVLKQVVTELDQQGVKQRGFVYQGSSVLAWQERVNNTQTVEWEHREPSSASFRMTTATGYAVTDRSAELDPTGADRGVTDPFQFSRIQPQSEGLYPAFDNGAGSGATQCRLDGVNMPCDVVMGFNNHGFGQIDPRTSYLGPEVVIKWMPDHPVNRPHPNNPNAIVVNVNGHASGHWEFVNLPQKPATGEDIQPRNLLAHIFHLLDDNRCSTFVSDMINVARQLTGKKPFTYDGKELAVAVSRQENGGFVFTSGANGGGGAGSAGGDIFSGTAGADTILFNTAYGPRNLVGVQYSYALTMLHEIMHLAGGGASERNGGYGYYTDMVMASAASHLTGAPGYPGGYDPNMPIWQITAEMTEKAGDYWDAQLREHCMPQEYR